ncbi:hypothetical protein [Selenomonas sp. AB3002]|uniref:hypothetical protein n=1 Tax=Selenomonas sp. AB3002 TaxID=1392502 RepID=UPI000497B3D3
MKRLIFIVIICFVLCIGLSGFALAEDVYLESRSINATGSKKLDSYLVTESISITNDVCYADVKEVYKGNLFDMVNYMFCFSPKRDSWVYKTKSGKTWLSLENNSIASKIFYGYIEPRL